MDMPDRLPGLAVIGSAGRGDDAPRMSRALYDSMFAQTLLAMKEWGVDRLVSGGAAWADHLAVRAYLEGAASKLVLFLPARFERGAFVPDAAVRFNPGRTLTRYHSEFSRACSFDSIVQIKKAIEKGAEVAIHPGFHSRNDEVAKAATHMVAFTFGDYEMEIGSDANASQTYKDFLPDEAGFRSSSDGGLRDGGTAHTWRQAWRPSIKRHVNLFALSAIVLNENNPPSP